MTEMDTGSSTTGQVKEKAREGAQQAMGQVQDKAQQARGQVSGRLREQVDQRSTQAGEQASSFAQAIRRTGEQLRSEGQDGPAKVTDQVADRAERLSGYLRESDGDRILNDVEDFARRQPWAVAFGGAVLGFVASRFLKASSSRRYESRETYGYPMETYPGYVSPAERELRAPTGIDATVTAPVGTPGAAPTAPPPIEPGV